MGSINPGNIGPANLAGSFAGGQSNPPVNESRDAGAQKTFQADLKAMAAQASGDVSEADLETDRDADGRMPFGNEHGQAQDESSNQETEDSSPKRAPDAMNERGNQLDLDA